MMKVKMLKTVLTPWGEFKLGEEIDSNGRNFNSLVTYGYAQEIKPVKEKPKAKAKKKTDA